jgi:hypothetical protein
MYGASMTLKDKRWIRDLVVLPIVVGIVLGLIQLSVDIYRTKEKVVSIAVDGPFPLIKINEFVNKSKIMHFFEYSYPPDEEEAEIAKKEKVRSTPNAIAPASGGKITMRTEIRDPQVYSVTVTNSGALPIKDLPISLVFEGATDSLFLLSLQHKTMPPHEFGKIEEDFTNKNRPRVVYSLLNPKDRDEIVIVINEKADLKAYAKAEGVHIVEGHVEKSETFSTLMVFIIAIISALMALLIQLKTNAIRQK